MIDRRSSTSGVLELAAHGGAAALAGVAANLIVLAVGLRLTELPPIYRIGAMGPVLVPAVAGVAGAALYWVLDRRSEWPRPVFLRASGGGLLISGVPIAIAAWVYDLGLLGVGVLVAMHVAVAVVVVAVVLALAEPRVQAG